MGSRTKALLISFVLFACVLHAAAGVTAQQRYVVTNDNPNGANTATVYLAGGTELNPTLAKLATIPTGGLGTQYAYFAANLANSDRHVHRAAPSASFCSMSDK